MLWLGRDLSTSICEYSLWRRGRIPEHHSQDHCRVYVGLSSTGASYFSKNTHFVLTLRLSPDSAHWGWSGVILLWSSPVKDPGWRSESMRGLCSLSSWGQGSARIETQVQWWCPLGEPQSPGSKVSWKVMLVRRYQCTSCASGSCKRIIGMSPARGIESLRDTDAGMEWQQHNNYLCLSQNFFLTDFVGSLFPTNQLFIVLFFPLHWFLLLFWFAFCHLY